VNRQFEFNKRSQLLIGPHHEALPWCASAMKSLRRWQSSSRSDA